MVVDVDLAARRIARNDAAQTCRVALSKCPRKSALVLRQCIHEEVSVDASISV